MVFTHVSYTVWLRINLIANLKPLIGLKFNEKQICAENMGDIESQYVGIKADYFFYM